MTLEEINALHEKALGKPGAETPQCAYALFDAWPEIYDALKKAEEAEKSLFVEIEHGDKDHRDWLRLALEHHFRPFRQSLAKIGASK